MAPGCPTQPQILKFVLAGAPVPDTAVAEHLGACSSCRALVGELRAIAAEIARSAEERTGPGPECLDELALARAVAGAADDERRNLAVAHLATCAYCQREVAAISRVLADPAVTREVHQVRVEPPIVGEQPGPRRSSLARTGRRTACAFTVIVVSMSFVAWRSVRRARVPVRRRGQPVVGKAGGS